LLRAAAEVGRHRMMRKAHPWQIKARHFFDESDRLVREIQEAVAQQV
jgi:hypothetical protein